MTLGRHLGPGPKPHLRFLWHGLVSGLCCSCGRSRSALNKKSTIAAKIMIKKHFSTRILDAINFVSITKALFIQQEKDLKHFTKNNCFSREFFCNTFGQDGMQ